MRFQNLFQTNTDSYRHPVFDRGSRILVTGVTSIHGWPVFRQLSRLVEPSRLFAVRSPKMAVPEGENVVPLCITDREGLIGVRDRFKPTHVIHGAGVCDLDVCEERPEWARAINQEGTRAVTEIFGADSHILYLSTDLVFSGVNPPSAGYAETDTPDPVNVAGRTFAQAEGELSRAARHCIVRLGLPIGDSLTGDKGAVDFVEGRFKRGLCMTLFHDELRSCITCDEIGRIVARLAAGSAEGLFHLGGAEPVSLYEIGRSIIEKGGYPGHLLKRLSRHEEKKGPPRIGNVALDSTRLVSWLDRNFR
jgi:dTDP-4-dehydrorhamnose reductase